MNNISSIELAKYLDFANHHADATPQAIDELCKKVLECGFNSAFVNPMHAEFAKEIIGGGAKVGTVVSFLLGQEPLFLKVTSAEASVLAGADKIDVSLNVGYIKSEDNEKFLTEMKEIVYAVKKVNDEVIVKFIPETGYLRPDKIKKMPS